MVNPCLWVIKDDIPGRYRVRLQERRRRAVEAAAPPNLVQQRTDRIFKISGTNRLFF